MLFRSELLGHLLRGFHVHALGDLLDQGHDVAHPQHALCVAVGIEDFQAVDLFRDTGELDGRARDLAHRQRSTAARIAVKLGQHDTGQRQRFLEGLGRVDRILGQEVISSLQPGQVLVSIVNKELAATMGEGVADINLNAQPPAVILMAGLQGAGKTTTTAKLAKHLIEKRKKKVLTVSGDVYRPAAIEQLKTMMKKFKGGGLMKMMKKMGGMKAMKGMMGGGGMPKLPF